MKSSRQKKSDPSASAGAVARSDITVRQCQTIEEFESCVHLEQEVWKSSDIDVVPVPLFVVASETGGQVLGAYNGKDLIGFTMAVAGWRNREPFLHSHMTAVSEAYRNRGIGRQLKLFQRADALARGISLIEWTFDPLVARNAYFNLMRLGAIARRYVPNAYGITTSPLHGALPTDRLVAEWHLRSPGVLCVIAGENPAPAISSEATRISVPADIEKLRTANPAKAVRIQSKIRDQFTQWFKSNYTATSIASTKSGMEYILEPWMNLGAGSTRS